MQVETLVLVGSDKLAPATEPADFLLVVGFNRTTHSFLLKII